MMLLTCATHLISVTIVRNYWRFPWLAFLRVVCITFVFIATGLLMTNQNTDGDINFPTSIPYANETDSSLFLPAACFQNNEHTAVDTFKETTSNAKSFFMDSIAKSTPRNKIQGWNLYIITLLFYGAATIAELVRFLRRGKSRPGWRASIGDRFRRCCGSEMLRTVVRCVFLFYLLAGLGISCAVTIISSQYIFNLRAWVDKSGWIQRENNQNPENDAKSFGQLVPILSSTLILFSFAQIISEKCTRHNNRKHEGEEFPPQAGTIQYFDPSTYNIIPPQVPEKNKKGHLGSVGVSTASLPWRIDLENQPSWSSDRNVASAQAATPLLGSDGYFSSSAAPEPNITGGRTISLGQSIQPGSGSGSGSGLPSQLPSSLRTRDETQDTTPTSSRSSSTPQSRSLIGIPNLNQQSA
ncbi:Protein OS-9 [Hypoxylon texense]